MNARAQSAPITTADGPTEGSLLTTPLDRVLAACRRSQLTGLVRVESDGKAGQVQLRAGVVSRAEIGGWAGPGVLAALRSLRDGRFVVVPRLPDAVDANGDPGDAPLAQVLRQCEERALTCSLIVTAPHDRARIDVRAGTVERVELNGLHVDDALEQVMRWSAARFQVVAARLEIDRAGDGDQAAPLPPPPTWLRPLPASIPPLRELRFEDELAIPFSRDHRGRGPLLWWATIAMVVLACAGIAVLT